MQVRSWEGRSQLGKGEWEGEKEEVEGRDGREGEGWGRGGKGGEGERTETVREKSEGAGSLELRERRAVRKGEKGRDLMALAERLRITSVFQLS